MLVARRFVIRGRVQGVGFRFFVQEAASTEGIAGWVGNLEDGTVETYAEGDREAMDRFERHLRHGPSRARVDRVDREEHEPAGTLRGFQVRP